MAGYLLRRLLLVLPTVWLVCSLVFLLSKVIPGTYTDRFTEAEQATIGGALPTPLSRTTYLRQLRQSGQDKPLFYVSLTTWAQPDTLNRVFPVQDQELLQHLHNRYGNWPEVVAYYRQLRIWQLDNSRRSNSPGATVAHETIAQLLHTADPAVISRLLQPGLPALAITDRKHKMQVKQTFEQLQRQARPFVLFIPVIRWHGHHNQYHMWLKDFVRGDLGRSYRDGQPVGQLLGEAISNTLLLLLFALVLTFVLGIELALGLSQGAMRHGRQLVLSSLYFLDSIPLFIVALLLLTVLAGAGYLNIFPVFGLGMDPDSDLAFGAALLDRLHHLLLPTFCLLLASVPYVTTQLYQELQQVAKHPFITTARSKGLSEKKVLRRHVFRNALLPLVTLFTGYLPVLISGAVIIEVIFAIPGTGRLLAESVMARDYPVIIGMVFFLAATKALAHVLADALYFVVDPRTRLQAV
jgi:peptide/nickel transport system permease protein